MLTTNWIISILLTRFYIEIYWIFSGIDFAKNKIKKIKKAFGMKFFRQILENPLKTLFKGTVIVSLFFVLSFIALIILHSVFNFTTTNAVLYIIKDEEGKIGITRDLGFNESNKLLFMLDASCIFHYLEGLASAVIDEPYIELTWDKKEGKGVIKEFRPDGTRLLLVLSRYKEEEGAPQGVFLGGDLPYGDVDRWKDRDRNNTGMSYYDGNKWYHIWCSINEGMSMKDVQESIEPWDWKYIKSNVIKSSGSEIILESLHELNTSAPGYPIKLLMRRTLSKKAGDDYFKLKIDISNVGKSPVFYLYTLGDEPWVGEFGDSSGDVGWTNVGLYKHESYVSPYTHNFVGFWDIGNEAAKEWHNFSGYANFVEWLLNRPAIVYFSNSFTEVNERRPLDSKDNRIINLLWIDQELRPGDTKSYILAIGMAKRDPKTGLPVKPIVDANY